MYLIDTNIFLELLLNRENAESCEKLLQKISEGEIKCIVTSLTIHAVEGVLSDNLQIIATFLRNINYSLGVSIYFTTLEEDLEITFLAEKVDLDFDDGLQYFVAKKLGVEAIISFDRHFDGLDIKIKEPDEILQKFFEENAEDNEINKK